MAPRRCPITEDNASFLDAASTLPRRQGLDVVRTASNGADAVSRSRELRSDFTDLIRKTPAAGFVAKSDLSADAIRQVLG